MCGNMKSVCVFMRGTIFCCHAFLFVEYYERRKPIMPDYEKMYFTLFNKVSDIIEELKEIQCEMEEVIIDDNNTEE